MKRVVLAALVAACGDDGHTTAPDAAAPDAPADAAPRTITGTAMDHYLSPIAGEQIVAPDLSTAMVASYAADGTRRPGTGGLGVFTFPVDADAASWRWSIELGDLGVTDGFVSSAAAPDASQFFLGRPDAVQPTMPTTTTFALGGMTPWQSADHLDVFAPGNGGYDYDLEEYPFARPLSGATSIAQTADWEDLFIPLTDASKGDRLDVLHQASVTDGGFTYNATTEVAEVADLMQVDGAPSTVTGTFAPVTRDQTVAIDWRGSAFATQTAAVGVTDNQSVLAQVQVQALPQASAHGVYQTLLPPLAALVAPSTTDATGALTFGVPFTPGAWDAFLFVRYTWIAKVHVGAQSGIYPVGFTSYLSLADAAAGPLVPTLTPPTNITVNGQPGLGADPLTGIDTQPTLAWAPPATGTPTAYEIDLVAADSFGSNLILLPVAEWKTTETSFTVPAGALLAGTTYVAVISALRTNDDYSAAPFLDTLGFARADAVTAPFTP